jgi:hypothetical protein
MRPPRALPAAHFERNDVTIICEIGHTEQVPGDGSAACVTFSGIQPVSDERRKDSGQDVRVWAGPAPDAETDKFLVSKVGR